MRRHKPDPPPAPNDDGGLHYWTLAESERGQRYLKEAAGSGRRFPAPRHATVAAPAVFDTAVRWAEDLGGDAVRRHLEHHEADYQYVGALLAVGIGGDGEAVTRLRARQVRLALAARALDADLMRLESAFNALLKAMESEFTRAWFFREHIARVRFPTVDTRLVAYEDRGGLSGLNDLGGLGGLGGLGLRTETGGTGPGVLPSSHQHIDHTITKGQ